MTNEACVEKMLLMPRLPESLNLMQGTGVKKHEKEEKWRKIIIIIIIIIKMKTPNENSKVFR